MDWYYAVGGERFGPFDQGAFDQLVAQGRITGVTLVWREGLDEWVQYQSLADPTPGTPGAIPPAMVQCSQCHRRAATDDMVQYQGHWVCAECKDTFYQRVREGSFHPQDQAGAGRLRYAGFWIRFGAAILDGLILIVAYSLLGFIASGILMSSRGDIGVMLWTQFLVFFGQVAILIGYITWFLGKFGATPGKMACGLKVRVSDGRNISYARAFGRAWAILLSFMIAYIGVVVVIIATIFTIIPWGGPDTSGPAIMVIIIVIAVTLIVLVFFPFYMAGLTKQKCALHDFICNTRVVHAR